MKSRGAHNSIKVEKGLERRPGDGHRVWLITTGRNETDRLRVSVYPEDARKFAMELIAMADECEPK